MELFQLEYFIAEAEEKSYTSAAKRMFVSRQALTKSIRQLEDHMGCRLLMTGNNTLYLTPAGERLYEKGAALLEEIRKLEQEVRSAAANRQPLKIAVSDTLLPNIDPLLLKALSDFSVCYQGAIAAIDEVPNNSIANCMQDGYDFGILIGDFMGIEVFRGFTLTRLRSWPLCFTMPKKHVCAQKGLLELSDLSRNTLIVPGDPELYLHTLYRECLQEGLALKSQCITDTAEASHMLEQENWICCDIEYPYYNTKLTQMKLSGSSATISEYLITADNTDNYNSDLLKDFLIRALAQP